MKKRSPCALPCNIPVHQKELLQVMFPMWDNVPYCCSWAVVAFSPVSCNGTFCLLRVYPVGFFSYVIKGPAWGQCWLIVVWCQQSDHMLALNLSSLATVALPCNIFSLLFPQRLSLSEGLAVNPFACPQFICWSCSHTEFQGSLPVLYLICFCWWAVLAVRLDYCPQFISWSCVSLIGRALFLCCQL